MSTKILVTGAAGFIGSHFAKLALEKGCLVLGIDNFSPYYDVNLKHERVSWVKGLHPQFEVVSMDLCDGSRLKTIFEDFRPEAVVHLAAQPGVRHSLDNPMAYVDSNLVAFAHVLECVRHYRPIHFVFASSSSVYGANTNVPFAEGQSTDHPVSLYSATKKCNEALAHSYAHLFGVPTTGLRFFTVYGPWGRPDMAVFSFTRKILNQEPLHIFHHGQHYRDFTYIDDIVDGVWRVTQSPAQPDLTWSSEAPKPQSSSAPFRMYNIGNEQPVLLNEFILALESTLGHKAIRIPVDQQPGDVLNTFADMTLFKKTFGPLAHTPLTTGLARFYEWYHTHTTHSIGHSI